MITEKRNRQKKPAFLGGWLPKEWWGKGTPKCVPPTEAEPPPPVVKPALTDQQIKEYRLNLEWIRAIFQYTKPGQPYPALPFRWDLTNEVPGELYFLALCQTMFREMKCKEVLGQQLEGEDLVKRLVYGWGKGPLTAQAVYSAMEGTSVERRKWDDDDD